VKNVSFYTIQFSAITITSLRDHDSSLWDASARMYARRRLGSKREVAVSRRLSWSGRVFRTILEKSSRERGSLPPPDGRASDSSFACRPRKLRERVAAHRVNCSLERLVINPDRPTERRWERASGRADESAGRARSVKRSGLTDWLRTKGLKKRCLIQLT